MSLKPPVSPNASLPTGRIYFNVVSDYGARGDGATDDTNAIQRAINAAVAVNGTVYFPTPSSSYKITSTIGIEPSSGTQARVNLEAEGIWTSFSWAGSNNDSVFRSLGWNQSIARGIKVVIPASATGVVAWDIDTDSTYTSSGNLTFDNCPVSINATATNCVAWRMGHSGGSNIATCVWRTCDVGGNVSGGGGHIGWVWEHLNCLGYTWINCGASNLASAWTNQSTSGSALSQQGGDGMTWIGPVTTANQIDFDFATAGAYSITGGRGELGYKLLQTRAGSNQYTISISGGDFADYVPSDGRVFYLDSPTNLVLSGCNFPKSSGAHTASFIKSTKANTSVTMLGCGIKGVDPAWTIDVAGPMTVLGSTLLDASGQPSAAMAQRVNTPPTTVPSTASAATVTLPAYSEVHTISGTTTITSVTASWVGRRVTLIFSGALTFTDGSNLKLAGDFVTTADDTISLVCDGTNWIETSRSVN